MARIELAGEQEQRSKKDGRAQTSGLSPDEGSTLPRVPRWAGCGEAAANIWRQAELKDFVQRFGNNILGRRPWLLDLTNSFSCLSKLSKTGGKRNPLKTELQPIQLEKEQGFIEMREGNTHSFH